MKKYVISRTSNANFLLAEMDIEDTKSTLKGAEELAGDLALATGENHFVFEVDMKLMSTARVTRSVEVSKVDPAE